MQAQLYIGVLRRQGLGHLQLQIHGRHAAGAKRQGHLVDQRRVGELRARQVHRHGARCTVAQYALPAHELAARFVEHKFTERPDQARLFGDFDELHRRHDAPARVAPAHQRLGGDADAADQVDDGLVDDKQLAFEQCPAQPVLHAAPPFGALLHRGLEDTEACAAVALGFAHRDARVLQQRIGVGTRRCVHHDAHAGADMHQLSADAVRLAQRVQQALRDGLRVVGMAQPFEHNDEFVATQARSGSLRSGWPAHRVASPYGAVQAAGQQPQQRVTGVLAERDIDAVEAVAVDEHDRKLIAGLAARRGQRALDTLQHHGAVWQRGQVVGAVGVAQLQGQPLLFLVHHQCGVAEADHQRTVVLFQQAQLERLGQGAARSTGRQHDPQRFADDTSRRGEAGGHGVQLRCGARQHVEQVEQVAFRRQRHQQLRRHRVDHHDLAVRRHLHQADRRLVQELHQRLIGRRGFRFHAGCQAAVACAGAACSARQRSTRLRPCALAAYIAVSARLSRSATPATVLSMVATPALTV